MWYVATEPIIDGPLDEVFICQLCGRKTKKTFPKRQLYCLHCFIIQACFYPGCEEYRLVSTTRGPDNSVTAQGLLTAARKRRTDYGYVLDECNRNLISACSKHHTESFLSSFEFETLLQDHIKGLDCEKRGIELDPKIEDLDSNNICKNCGIAFRVTGAEKIDVVVV